MVRFVVSSAPHASALWKIWAHWDLEAECLGTTDWGLVSPPEEKCTIILWTLVVCPMRPLLTLYTLSSKFFFFLFCLVTKYIWARDIIVQRLGSCKRKRNNSWTENFPLVLNNHNYSLSAQGAEGDHLTSAWPQIARSQTVAIQPKNPFHYLTQLEVQLWTVPLS